MTSESRPAEPAPSSESPTASRVQRRVVVAGWMLIALAILHLVNLVNLGAAAATAGAFPVWFSGGLWLADMSVAGGYFWASLGGFPIPMIALGWMIVHLARAGSPVPRGIPWLLLVWIIGASLVLGLSGFVVAIVPIVLLLSARPPGRG